MTATEAGASQTNWSLIFEASQSEDASANKALTQLMRRYWPPVYAYVRSTGKDVHEAADLTQGFVCDVMLARQIFHKADPKRGRFRTLLLHALKNYLKERHRYDKRAKRDPGDTPLSMADDNLVQAEVPAEYSPEQAFATQWSATLIRRVFQRLQAQCHREGFDSHWIVFESRIVRPMIFGERHIPYKTLVAQLELNDPAQAANMLVTVKRKFVHLLLEEIANTVMDPRYVEDELRTLIKELESRV